MITILKKMLVITCVIVNIFAFSVNSYAANLSNAGSEILVEEGVTSDGIKYHVYEIAETDIFYPQIILHKEIKKYKITWDGKVTPPKYYYYNQNGWKGNLTLDGYDYDDFPINPCTTAIYSGTVNKHD